MQESLVGRDGEFAAALQCLEHLRAGPAALLFEGEPGIGKSMLWRRTVEVAGERGVRVLEARPSEAEAKLPYAALGDLLECELEATVAHLPAPQRRALEVALLLADPDGELPDQRAIAVAVLGVLRSLAATGGVVVAVDDLQWLDADSARALTFALRRLSEEPVLTLLARRAGLDPTLPLGLDGARVVRVPVGPLEPGALHALLVARLDLRLARPLLLRVHAAAGGNPLYGLEIARALAGAGGQPAATDALPVPATLEGVLAARLTGLSAAARQALAAVAAVGQPTRALVAAVGPEFADGLDEALAAGLVRVEDDRLRFVHPLYGSAASARLDAEQRRALHRRLAELVDDPEAHALHLAFALAGPDAAAARIVGDAARRAAARGAPDAALALAVHALRLAPADQAAERGALSLEASDFAFAAGDTRLARRLLTDALAEADPGQRSAMLVGLATLATYDGSMSEARDLAEQALADAPEDPSLRVVIHRRLALVHMLSAQLDVAEHHARAAVELAEAHGDAPSLARALANLACITVLRGDPVTAGPAIERALALEDAPGVASIDDSPSAVAGLLLMYAGELGAGRRRLESGLARAQSRGGDPLSTGLLFALSELESRAGRFREARDLARRGLDASDQTDQSTERAVLLFANALAEAHLGDTEAARAGAGEGLAIAERAEHCFAEAQNRWVLGFLELSAGRPAEAWAALEPVVAMLRREVGELAVVPVHPDAIEALLALGRVDEARALIEELGAAMRPPWLQAAAGRCRGLLQASVGETDAAIGRLEDAVEAHRGLENPFALARTLLALGAVQRRAKRRAAARVSLEAAERLFAELGAEQWVLRARSEAARLGGRRPGNRDELTQTERRIAELAAAGRSNREIAGELFVSERTVEANLTRSYRKLGVRSRSELARSFK